MISRAVDQIDLSPSGLIRSLASRKVEIDGEQEEEEEEEEGANAMVKKPVSNRVRSAVSNIVVQKKGQSSHFDPKKGATESPDSFIGWVKFTFKFLWDALKVMNIPL
jgi:hypothetical protein